MTVELTFKQLSKDAVLAQLELNRPESANALNEEMITALHTHLDAIAAESRCRLLILRGRGKNFCGGADLGWMRATGEMNFADNLASSQILSAMFEKLHALSVPTLALAQGSSFGGGVGLLACCDIVIASPGSRFCLSEVKWGILPAVILPFLQKKMHKSSILHLGLTARLFQGEEAKNVGLVHLLTPEDDAEKCLRTEANHLLSGGPRAQAAFKQLNSILIKDPNATLAPIEFIAKARTSAEGQAGLKAFLKKSTPPWVVKLED